MHYLVLSFFAASCFAFSILFNKLASKHSINHPDSLFAYFMMIAGTFALVLIPFIELALPSIKVAGLVVAMTLSFLAGGMCFYRGIFETDASALAPLFQVQAGLIAILSFVFLGERFPMANYLWLILLLVGVLLVSANDKMNLKTFATRGTMFILAMQVLHALSNLFVGLALESTSPLQLMFWEYALIGLLAPVFILWRKPKLDYQLQQVSPLFVSTFLGNIGSVALVQAFTQNMSISSAIGMLSSPIVFVVSVIASVFAPQLLEHHPPKVYLIRGVGLLVILVAAFQIAMG